MESSYRKLRTCVTTYEAVYNRCIETIQSKLEKGTHERTEPNLDDGVDETVSLRSAEKPDGALLNDVVVDPARHGDGPRAAGDDHVGQEEALGQISTRE